MEQMIKFSILPGIQYMREHNAFIEMQNQLYTINKYYEKIKMHANNYDFATLDLAKEILGLKGFGGISENIIQLTSVLFDNRNFLKIIARKSDEELRCVYVTSPQQVFVDILNILDNAEGQAYFAIYYSYKILSKAKLYNEYDSLVELRRYRREMLKRFELSKHKFSEIAKMKSKEYRACDPSFYKEGINYEQITKLLQGSLEYEMNLDHNTCFKTCSDYKYVSHRIQNKYDCKGALHDCTFIDADMNVCNSNEKSVRKYQVIEYKDGTILGNKTECENEWKNVKSKWTWLGHCTYCMCYCEDHTDSDRYWNIREVNSDIMSNRVVTGVRFVKHNRIIHLQIQQGQLLKNGRININSLEWKPVEDYSVTDSHKSKDLDYFKLHYNRRSIDLDDLHVDKGYVVTGVRFRLDDMKRRLKLEIGMTPYNASIGLLTRNIQKWQHNSRRAEKRINLKNSDLPTKSFHSTKLSGSNEYITFTHSDLHKDVAQSTIPFIDSQAVAPRNPTPLAGIGIFHKREEGFGGFIAPKVFTFNIDDF
ncbi:uncharacterized protein LOC109609294 [Aethina tumida]|uniref:uncharacterized protein LOC109609294 n=1 Tax=Aethina tumida TaxID=116153 RepID=UPI00214972BA|nr:uncharacterized protein LOC109609294 [Aethina tumida]